jgi:hypothetical protein
VPHAGCSATHRKQEVKRAIGGLARATRGCEIRKTQEAAAGQASTDDGAGNPSGHLNAVNELPSLNRGIFCKLGGLMQSASYSCSTEIYIRLLAGLSFGL